MGRTGTCADNATRLPMLREPRQPRESTEVRPVPRRRDGRSALTRHDWHGEGTTPCRRHDRMINHAGSPNRAESRSCLSLAGPTREPSGGWRPPCCSCEAAAASHLRSRDPRQALENRECGASMCRAGSALDHHPKFTPDVVMSRCHSQEIPVPLQRRIWFLPSQR